MAISSQYENKLREIRDKISAISSSLKSSSTSYAAKLSEIASLEIELKEIEDDKQQELADELKQLRTDLKKARCGASRGLFRQQNAGLINWALGPKEFSGIEDLKKMDGLFAKSDKIEGGGLDNEDAYCAGGKCHRANLKGITTGENSPSTIAAKKYSMVKDDLVAHNVNSVTPTNDEIQAAQDRINESKRKFCEANGLKFKPFDVKFFGDRSADELNKLAEWREKNGDKFKTREEIRDATKNYLATLDREFNYKGPLNPLKDALSHLKQKNPDFKFYEVTPDQVTAPNVSSNSSQIKSPEEQKNPSEQADSNASKLPTQIAANSTKSVPALLARP